MPFSYQAATKHDLFATVHGTLVLDNDRATIDRLWNRMGCRVIPVGSETGIYVL